MAETLEQRMRQFFLDYAEEPGEHRGLSDDPEYAYCLRCSERCHRTNNPCLCHAIYALAQEVRAGAISAVEQGQDAQHYLRERYGQGEATENPASAIVTNAPNPLIPGLDSTPEPE